MIIIIYISDFRIYKCEPSRGEVCVEIRKCPFFDDLLNRTRIPRPRSVIKLIRDNQCDFYSNTPYVCCEQSLPETKTETPSTTASTTTESISAPFDPNDIFGEIEDTSHENFINDIASHPNYRLLPNEICGPIATDRRITSGSKAVLNEYPWMALIAYDVGKLN